MVLRMFLLRSLFEVPSVTPSCFYQHFADLLQEADETDAIHDVSLQAGDRVFPAHKYILSARSEFFCKLFRCERSGGDGEGVVAAVEAVEAASDGEVQVGEDAAGCDLLILEKVPADMLEHALTFIYTNSCELLVHGTRPRGVASAPDQDHEQVQVRR